MCFSLSSILFCRIGHSFWKIWYTEILMMVKHFMAKCLLSAAGNSRQMAISMQWRAPSGLITVKQCTSVLSAEERVGVRSQGRQGDGDVEQQQTKQSILLIRGAVVWRGKVIIILLICGSAHLCLSSFFKLPVCMLPMAAIRVGSMSHWKPAAEASSYTLRVTCHQRRHWTFMR